MPASFCFLLPFPLTPANYKLPVLQPIDEGLENFKVMENIKVITWLISHHSMNAALQYSSELSCLFMLLLKYGEMGSTVFLVVETKFL